MTPITASVVPPDGASHSDEADWLKDFTRAETRSRYQDRLIIWLERLGIVVVALGIWQVLIALKFFTASTVGDPTGVVSYFFGTLLGQAGFWHNVGVTSEETILGLLLGVAAGAIVGIALGFVSRLANAFRPIIVGVNALPKIALAPLAVVWFGLGIESKIAIAAFGSFFVIFFSVVGGLAAQDRALTQNARMLGVSRWRILTTVTLPSIGVWVVTALKVAISVALVGAVVTEYLGANAGLGYEIQQSIDAVEVTRMMALLIAVAFVGCATYSIVSMFERVTLRWR